MKKHIVCKICGKNSTKIIYSGTLRNGKFGVRTNENYLVYKCKYCSVAFIEPTPPNLKIFYETENYRRTYDSSTDLREYQRSHDSEASEYLNQIGIENIRDKIVADYGAGGGSFLDSTYGFVSKGIAIEPASIYHKALSSKYSVYSWSKDFVKTKFKIDVATAFDVLEHVEEPLNFLCDIYKSLNKGGKLYILVPNHADILKQLCKDHFNLYDYRTAHLFYFDKLSLKYLLKNAGFKSIRFKYYHKYDLSNLISWLMYHKPTGLNKIKFWSPELNEEYIKNLQKIGKTSHIWVEAIK